ncbi:MAG: thiamine ABC transporter substrate-binding protein [Chloroflexi bacterium HGW-Chloroflexi-1]|nr:MAG: thiamine ABC transporter substrate-binding protein [Chloroflexi bacterium HGW-Chloroflexi-1]
MNKHAILVVMVVLTVLLAGCLGPVPTPGPTAAPPATAGRTLTVMTHDSFSVSEDVVAAFQAGCACQVRFLKSGDTGLALNKAILSKDNPLADVFYGVDNSFLSRALAAEIFEPYTSPALAGIPDDLKLDPENRLLPVDFGYVTLNYDKAYFADKGIPLPKTLRDLTDPAYKGLLVVENPATSSPGLVFLLTTIAVFDETGNYTYLDFWRDLRANDVLVVDGWKDAYYGQFSGGSGEGDRPLVVSYATSPAAEVFFTDPQPKQSPTGNILPPGESFRQVELVGVLRGAANSDLARQWIDFMLGETFQADIPLQMWVYPVRAGTPLPEVFTKFAQAPAEAASLAPAQIESGREGWLQAWTDAVLR